MKFGYNVKGTDPARARQGGGKQAPVGMYSAKVTGCVVAKPENKDERLEIVYALQNTSEGFASLYDYISLENENVKWKLDQFLQAMGETSDAKREGQGDTDAYIGKTVKLRVRADSYQGEYRAKVGGVWKPGPTEEASSNGDGGGITWDDISAMTEDELNADQDLLDTIQARADEMEIDTEAYDEWVDVVAAINEYTPEPEEQEDAEEEDDGDDDWNALLEMEESDLEINEDAIRGYAEQYEIDPDDYETWTEVIQLISEAMGGGEVDYDSLSIPELKAACEERELPTGGTKAALIKRLKAADELDDNGPGLPD